MELADTFEDEAEDGEQTPKDTEYRYEFPIILCGIGKTPEDGWNDAVESFSADPGAHEEFTAEEFEG